MFLKCPKCGSTKLYHTVSVAAKQNINTGRIYEINKNNIDGDYETVECDKCGWILNQGLEPELYEKYNQDNWGINE